MAFDQAARVGAEVAEFAYFDAGFEAVDALDAGKGVCIGLEMPEAEEFVVEP